MSKLNILMDKKGFVGPTFTFSNRLKRLIWKITWFTFARWSPPHLHKWRILILKLFGAKISWKAYIYPNVEIWAPWNLMIDDYGTLARNVICYNIAPIELSVRAVVSQGAHLCTGTHNYEDPAFPLTAKPIYIGSRAWVCADTFVGPGVKVSSGAILSAGSVALRNLDSWSIYGGNPAILLRTRLVIRD